MVIKLGRISRSHYLEVISFIKSSALNVGEDEFENMLIVNVLYKMVNKMQNNVINHNRPFISFSVNIAEAWALRKVYRYAYPTGELMAYIFPLIEKIEKNHGFISGL